MLWHLWYRLQHTATSISRASCFDHNNLDPQASGVVLTPSTAIRVGSIACNWCSSHSSSKEGLHGLFLRPVYCVCPGIAVVIAGNNLQETTSKGRVGAGRADRKCLPVNPVSPRFGFDGWEVLSWEIQSTTRESYRFRTGLPTVVLEGFVGC